MDIYKLKDEIPDRKPSRLTKTSKSGIIEEDILGEVKEESGELKVTSLKQGAKNPNRVNVFVNGKFSFSLDVAQAVDYKVKVGELLSIERLSELKNASGYGKLYQRTLEWALIRPRSKKEVTDYLYRKLKTTALNSSLRAHHYGAQSPQALSVGCEKSSEDITELSCRIIETLTCRGYIDDRKFAEWYVENRFAKKGASRKRLRMELMKKGVAREIIDEVPNGRVDEDEIQKIIQRKRAKYDDEKLIAYLCRQGFSYDLVQQAVSESRDEA